jgi:hypothetical protein
MSTLSNSSPLSVNQLWTLFLRVQWGDLSEEGTLSFFWCVEDQCNKKDEELFCLFIPLNISYFGLSLDSGNSYQTSGILWRKWSNWEMESAGNCPEISCVWATLSAWAFTHGLWVRLGPQKWFSDIAMGYKQMEAQKNGVLYPAHFNQFTSSPQTLQESLFLLFPWTSWGVFRGYIWLDFLF